MESGILNGVAQNRENASLPERPRARIKQEDYLGSLWRPVDRLELRPSRWTIEQTQLPRLQEHSLFSVPHLMTLASEKGARFSPYMPPEACMTCASSCGGASLSSKKKDHRINRPDPASTHGCPSPGLMRSQFGAGPSGS